jgi:hypothetical protein
MPLLQRKEAEGIHLMRGMNTDLLKNPFDGEFKDLVAAFSSLLSAAVATIDKHGLKARYLKRHKRGFERWMLDLFQKCFHSQVAESFRDRILRNKDRLFTFAERDGVPWNNSNAEHAIRGFTINRDQTNGCRKETGLQSYLVLLSLRQTCAYQGVNFLDFLLSREMDVDEFARRPKRRRATPSLESYPVGFIPSNREPFKFQIMTEASTIGGTVGSNGTNSAAPLRRDSPSWRMEQP